MTDVETIIQNILAGFCPQRVKAAYLFVQDGKFLNRDAVRILINTHGRRHHRHRHHRRHRRHHRRRHHHHYNARPRPFHHARLGRFIEQPRRG